jgi:cellobiose phosphorylase
MSRYGHFLADDPDGAFILTDVNTPRPWQVYLFNERQMAQLDQFGHGYARYWNEKGEDVGILPEGGPPASRMIALRDASGPGAAPVIWSPAVCPGVTPPDEYGVVFSPSFWEARGKLGGLRASWRVFVPVEEPCELWTVRLTNETDTRKRVDLFAYSALALNGYCLSLYRFYASNTMYIQGHDLPDLHAVWVQNATPMLPHDRYSAFLACSEPYVGFDTSPASFLGHPGAVYAARALAEGRCGNTHAYEGQTCLALQIAVELEPGESRAIHWIESTTNGPEHIRAMTGRFFQAGAIEAELERVREARRRERDAAVIHSASPALDSLANVWGKVQNRLAVLFRKGFRDVLQDAAGMAVFDPSRAREALAEVFAVQRADGAGIRAWKPFMDKMEYSDGPYWLTLMTAAYLRETGDFGFLDESLPFLDGPPASVWEHMRRGLDYLYRDRNARGLVRIRFADWNDGLDGPGKGGEGDSTMVTMSLVGALRELKAIARAAGREPQDDPDERIATLCDALERQAWTGEYYIRGYRDDGRPYGAPSEKYGSIYLNPQAWAILCDVAPPDRWPALIETATRRLSHPYGFRLFHPAYPSYDPTIGRCSGELPGIFENGAVYNHSFAFFLHALWKAGRHAETWTHLQKLLPDSEANPSDRTSAEPYVLTNCIFTEEARHRAGTCRSGWWTGTAGWLLRLIHNEMTGLTPEFDGLYAYPGRVVAEMGLKRTSRFFRDTRYEVLYSHGDAPGIRIEGRPHDPCLPLPLKPGETVNVEITTSGVRR